MRVCALALGLAALFCADGSRAQTRVVKYGAEFLSAGVGARALGMGGAYVGHADDVTGAFWNVAGLHGLEYPQVALMHAQRFDGIVAYNYAAIAWPISARTTIAASFIRSSVDDIASTLAATNPDTGLPYPNPQDRIEFFSAADNALFLSASRKIRDNLVLGATAKIVRRGIGDFANAWGYSVDLAARYNSGAFQFGAVVQDATSLVQSWSVNEEEFAEFENLFEDGPPVGLTEITLPVARLGVAYERALRPDLDLTAALDIDVAFDGQQSGRLNAGDVSFAPRLGAELAYRNVVMLRGGIADILETDGRLRITPSVGAGLRLGAFDVDYSFGDFGGVPGELGFSHRVSVSYTLKQERFARPSP